MSEVRVTVQDLPVHWSSYLLRPKMKGSVRTDVILLRWKISDYLQEEWCVNGVEEGSWQARQLNCQWNLSHHVDPRSRFDIRGVEHRKDGHITRTYFSNTKILDCWYFMSCIQTHNRSGRFPRARYNFSSPLRSSWRSLRGFSEDGDCAMSSGVSFIVTGNTLRT